NFMIQFYKLICYLNMEYPTFKIKYIVTKIIQQIENKMGSKEASGFVTLKLRLEHEKGMKKIKGIKFKNRNIIELRIE
ncbi:hypothetical protein ACJX0J_025861, partial [Zea mays]